MFDRFKRLLRDESGITALETAIILIAFVVVAAVFAFTVLSAGMVSTEQGKQAILSGLDEVSSSLELRGNVLAVENIAGSATSATPGQIGSIRFTVGTVSGGAAIDLTAATADDSANKIVIDYRDAETAKSGLIWEVAWARRHDEDELLEDGELAEITIALDAQDPDAIVLGPDTAFAIEIKPPRGAVVLIQRTTPSYIDAVVDLR